MGGECIKNRINTEVVQFMIPILYSDKETDFNNNGIGLLIDAVECEVVEERNGVFELTLVYPPDALMAKDIKENYIVKAKPNDTDEPQLFRIYKSEKQIKGTVRYSAEHISYELNANQVSKPKIVGRNAQEALAQLLEEAVIQNKFTAHSDITTRNSTYIDEVVSVRRAFAGVRGSILDVWGGEYKFNNYRVELYKQRGRDNGIEIRYGKNLIEAKQEKNIADVATAIFPYCHYTPEGTDAEPVYITLPEKVIKTPNAAAYATVRCIGVDFSQDFESGTIVTVAMLRDKANAYVKTGIDEPKINLTVSFANLWQTKEYETIKALEEVGLCDTVTVHVERLGIDVKAKVIKYTYNVLKEQFKSVDIGEVKSNLANEITQNRKEIFETIIKTATRADKIKEEIVQKIKDVTAAITGNSGGHVVLHPAENPREIFIMDTPDTSTAKKVWRWNLAGLGYSSNGIGGPFKTAITADGQIVADFITAGKLLGSILEAGTVKAESLDVEYRQAVLKYTDDAKYELEQEISSSFRVTSEAIAAEVTRATKAEGTLKSSITVNANAITAEVTRSTNAEGALRSSITANATAINLKVSKGDVSSQISVESGQVTIRGNRFVVESTNFTLTAAGIATMNGANVNGKFKNTSGQYFIEIDTAEVRGGSGNKTYGSIDFYGGYSNKDGQCLRLRGYNSIDLMGALHVAKTPGANTVWSTANGTMSVVTQIKDIGNGAIQWWTANYTFTNGILTTSL